jgi:hypothetical protein
VLLCESHCCDNKIQISTRQKDHDSRQSTPSPKSIRINSRRRLTDFIATFIRSLASLAAEFISFPRNAQRHSPAIQQQQQKIFKLKTYQVILNSFK